MSEDTFLIIWVLGSLIIWLILEMSGLMAKARKDIVDGASKEFIFITCWVPILGFVLCMIPIIFIGWCVNKASKINIYSNKE